MQDLGPATDDQVILAWLQAEIDSPRFEDMYVFGWESAQDVDRRVKNINRMAFADLVGDRRRRKHEF